MSAMAEVSARVGHNLRTRYKEARVRTPPRHKHRHPLAAASSARSGKPTYLLEFPEALELWRVDDIQHGVVQRHVLVNGVMENLVPLRREVGLRLLRESHIKKCCRCNRRASTTGCEPQPKPPDYHNAPASTVKTGASMCYRPSNCGANPKIFNVCRLANGDLKLETLNDIVNPAEGSSAAFDPQGQAGGYVFAAVWIFGRGSVSGANTCKSRPTVPAQPVVHATHATA
jgi:hypothetical protein